MSATELLNILSNRCNTIDVPQRCRDVNAQMMQEKFYINKDSNPNPMVNNSKGYIVDYFKPNPSIEADKTASTKIIKIMHSEFKDVISE